jgi:hypothetical protein
MGTCGGEERWGLESENKGWLGLQPSAISPFQLAIDLNQTVGFCSANVLLLVWMGLERLALPLVARKLVFSISARQKISSSIVGCPCLDHLHMR